MPAYLILPDPEGEAATAVAALEVDAALTTEEVALLEEEAALVVAGADAALVEADFEAATVEEAREVLKGLAACVEAGAVVDALVDVLGDTAAAEVAEAVAGLSVVQAWR